MHRVVRQAATFAIGVLVVGLLAAAPAQAVSVQSTKVATVHDAQAAEYEVRCPSWGPPGPCTQHYVRYMYLRISVSNFTSGSPITFTYVIDHLTASASDYVIQHPVPAGQITVWPSSDAHREIMIRMVDDGVAEPTETFRLRLTGSSVPADLGDTGIGTITDGGHLPADCTMARVSVGSASMTCTARPPAQQWRMQAECNGFPPTWPLGTTVTGNGTSNVTCSMEPEWIGIGHFRLV